MKPFILLLLLNSFAVHAQLPTFEWRTYYLPCSGYTFALQNTPIGAVNTVWNIQPGNLTFYGNSFTLYNYQVPNNIPYTVKCTVSFTGNSTTSSYTSTIYSICRSGSARISTEKSIDNEAVDLEKDALVYPNPTNGNFNISLDKGLFNEKEALKAVIYRENGTILVERDVVNIENTIPFKLDNLQEGNYTVVIFSADKKISKKIIIQH